MQRLLPETSGQIIRERREDSVSIYKGELTTKNIINRTKDIKAAFPQLPPEFFDILAKRVKANKFSDARLNDAVGNLIDTCRYPLPTIADVISFDKRVKLYTYSELTAKVNQGYSMKDFKKLDDKKLWVSISDAENYNII